MILRCLNFTETMLKKSVQELKVMPEQSLSLFGQKDRKQEEDLLISQIKFLKILIIFLMLYMAQIVGIMKLLGIMY